MRKILDSVQGQSHFLSECHAGWWPSVAVQKCNSQFIRVCYAAVLHAICVRVCYAQLENYDSLVPGSQVDVPL